MNGIAVSKQAPADWAAMCAAENLLFHSIGWNQLLEASFDVQTQYIWDEATGCGGAVTAFSAGPFQLGYLGFPYGGVVGGVRLSDAMLRSWQAQRSALLPMAMRIPVSAFAEPVDLQVPYVRTAETAIVDLPSWTIDMTSGNHRRDIKKSMRSDLEIGDANQAAD
ncbi:MAG: hypothetical protein IIA11_05325, partial [Proteobacteria bacterium]|nr:hypothetical protein [Pseudomonadota bacterium]